MSQVNQLILDGGLRSQLQNSMREALDPLSVVAKQHFVEWFSGDAIDTIWTATASGTNNSAMADSIDGGFQIGTGTTNGNNVIYNHSDSVRHYAHDGSIIIFLMQRVAGTSYCDGGFQADSSFTDYAVMQDDTAGGSGNKEWKSNGSTTSTIDSGVAIDTSMTLYKIQLTSSAGYSWINGVLVVTESTSTDLPSVKETPYIRGGTRTTAQSNHRFRYLECYNT